MCSRVYHSREKCSVAGVLAWLSFPRVAAAFHGRHGTAVSSETSPPLLSLEGAMGKGRFGETGVGTAIMPGCVSS